MMRGALAWVPWDPLLAIFESEFLKWVNLMSITLSKNQIPFRLIFLQNKSIYVKSNLKNYFFSELKNQNVCPKWIWRNYFFSLLHMWFFYVESTIYANVYFLIHQMSPLSVMVNKCICILWVRCRLMMTFIVSSIMYIYWMKKTKISCTNVITPIVTGVA